MSANSDMRSLACFVLVFAGGASAQSVRSRIRPPPPPARMFDFSLPSLPDRSVSVQEAGGSERVGVQRLPHKDTELLDPSASGVWVSPDTKLQFGWVSLPTTPPRIHLEIASMGDTWVAIGISPDGMMANVPRDDPRRNPALVAIWNPFEPGKNAGPRWTPRALRYQLTEKNAANGLRLLDATDQPREGATLLQRRDGWSSLSFALGYTKDCGTGKMAACLSSATTFILARGQADTWPVYHGPNNRHSIQVFIPPQQPLVGYKPPRLLPAQNADERSFTSGEKPSGARPSCGPRFDGAKCDCQKNGRPFQFCNEQNGWCGDTELHRARSSGKFDCGTPPPEEKQQPKEPQPPPEKKPEAPKEATCGSSAVVGSCVDSKKFTCSGAGFVSGKCPGAGSVKCCPKPGKPAEIPKKKPPAAKKKPPAASPGAETPGCAVSCRATTCGTLRGSFTCKELAGFGCSCGACCENDLTPPCERKCRASTCGSLGQSLTCGELWELNCDCRGCCMDRFSSESRGFSVASEGGLSVASDRGMTVVSEGGMSARGNELIASATDLSPYVDAPAADDEPHAQASPVAQMSVGVASGMAGALVAAAGVFLHRRRRSTARVVMRPEPK